MQVVIEKRAVKEINRLDVAIANRIYDFLEEMENIDPRSKGKLLKGKLKHLWRYRVGDYRILTEIQDEVLIVLVIRVAHRSKVYS
jgi:mRNA interferase RelE/StbE